MTMVVGVHEPEGHLRKHAGTWHWWEPAVLGGDGAGVFAVQKEGAGFIAEGWGGTWYDMERSGIAWGVEQVGGVVPLIRGTPLPDVLLEKC